MIRKSVAKKSPKDLAICKELFYSKGKDKVSQATLDYLWNVQIMRQASYAFSILHTLAYTFIALIELTLYTKYPSIYWNCACLTVNAEAIDENEFDVDDEEEDVWQSNSNIEDEEEKEDDEENTQVVKSKSTDYGKVASAIAKMQTRGVNIVLPDINEANLSFYPDEKNDRIIFGLKGLVGINDQMVKDIIENRPYNSLLDFHNKLTTVTREITNKTGKTQNKALVPSGKVYNLIKAGCFDFQNVDRVKMLNKMYSLIAPKTPAIADVFNEKLKQQYEYDALGLYLNGHPLDKYHYASFSTFNENENAIISCSIEKIEEKQDKSGKMMGFISMKTKYEDVRGLVFSSNWNQKIKDYMSVPGFYQVTGTKSGTSVLIKTVKRLEM
jgi:DNA polymerase III alpha subunit